MMKTIQYAHGNTLSYAEYGSPGGFPILIQHGLIASIRPSHLFDRLIETGGAWSVSLARVTANRLLIE